MSGCGKRRLVAAIGLLLFASSASSAQPVAGAPRINKPPPNVFAQWARSLIGLQPAATPCSMAAIRTARAAGISPALIGCTYRDVQIALREFYPYTTRPTFAPHAETSGIIFDQSPSTGTPLVRSDPLSFSVSTGPADLPPVVSNSSADNGIWAVKTDDAPGNVTASTDDRKKPPTADHTAKPTDAPAPAPVVLPDPNDNTIIYPPWFLPILGGIGVLVVGLIGWWLWPKRRVADDALKQVAIEHWVGNAALASMPVAPRFSSDLEPGTSHLDPAGQSIMLEPHVMLDVVLDELLAEMTSIVIEEVRYEP